MNRVILAGALVVVAVVMSAAAFILDDQIHWTDLLANLGTEILGIALTVAIVDWLIERSLVREQARQIAWNMLHDLDHAVWVWQGGRREFHLDELVALLDLVQHDDPIPPFTQTLFANLGVRASDVLRLQSRVFRAHRRLRHAMQCLGGLGQIRELGNLMPASTVVEALKSAIADLSAVTEQPVHPGAFGVAQKFRDASVKAQEERYRGAQQEIFIAASPAGAIRTPGSK